MLFSAMISNHAFRDGNKRTAVVLLYAFLRANDHDLARIADDEVGSTVRAALIESAQR